MNVKNLNITLGQKYNAIFNGHGIDEKIQFVPVALYVDPDADEFSILVKNNEVLSFKNNKVKKFSIEDFVVTGVLSNRNIKNISEVRERIQV